MKEYVLGEHHVHIEKGVPYPGKFIPEERVGLLPIEKLGKSDSLATDYSYSRKNYDILKSKVSYIVKNKQGMRERKFSIRRDPGNKELLRIYRMN